MMRRYQQTAHALGSEAFLTLVSDQPKAVIDTYFAELWKTIHDFEQRFSRFLPTSELTQFNQAAGKKTPVSLEFIAALQAAKQLGKATDGLFNPFILPDLQHAGYMNSWPHPSQQHGAISYADRSAAAIDRLQIGKDWATMPETAALDFGGFGKGYLLDLLADGLPSGVRGYWFSLGGDILCDGYDKDGSVWQIAVTDALDTTQPVATIRNEQGKRLAIATSGVTKRTGTTAGGKTWHHIIDPRSGEPAQTDTLTVTAVTDKALDADVYAKVLVILGSSNAPAFAKAHKLDQAILQVATSTGTRVLTWPN